MSALPARVDSEITVSETELKLIHMISDASALIDNCGKVIEVNETMCQALLLRNIINGVGAQISKIFP